MAEPELERLAELDSDDFLEEADDVLRGWAVVSVVIAEAAAAAVGGGNLNLFLDCFFETDAGASSSSMAAEAT